MNLKNLYLFIVVLILGISTGCSSGYIEKSSEYQALKKEREKDRTAAMNYEMQYKAVSNKLKDTIQVLNDLRADCQKGNSNNRPVSSNQVLIPKPSPSNVSNNRINTVKQNLKIDKNKNESFSIIKDNKDEFTIYKVLDPSDIEFFLNDTTNKKISNFKNIKEINKNREMIFAMNAGIFKPGYIPEGLFVSKGKEIVTVNDKKGAGNFYTAPNGIFYINKKNKAVVITTKDYMSSMHINDISNATQSGPMLVIDGAINEKFIKTSSSKYVRNAVGVDDKGHVYFVISTKSVNLFSISDLFLNDLNCKNALYLDGAISKAYIPDQNKKSLYGNFGPMIAVFENQ